jgi:GNAT superfamily N-acetyltransferase
VGAGLISLQVFFNRESFLRVTGDLSPLIKEHYKEIAHYQDIPLAPDWDIYKRAEQMRSLYIYTARIDSKLVGYAIFFVRPNLHYSGSLQAQQDILFIKKEHRGFGRHFIKWCDDELRKEGVQVVMHHVKAKHNFGPMLERMGYELIDHIFMKRLDR